MLEDGDQLKDHETRRFATELLVELPNHRTSCPLQINSQHLSGIHKICDLVYTNLKVQKNTS
jgi:hypothetical protein